MDGRLWDPVISIYSSRTHSQILEAAKVRCDERNAAVGGVEVFFNGNKHVKIVSIKQNTAR